MGSEPHELRPTRGGPEAPGSVTSHSYVVARADGKEFGFQRNTIHYLERLARILREECRTKRKIAWDVVEEGPA